MKQPSIIVKNLEMKMQGNTVLDGISFLLNTGEYLALVGDSGSGKTLLAKALAGQLFYKGTIEINKDQHVLLVEQHYHFKNLSNVSDFYYQQRYNSFDADNSATVTSELMEVANDEANTLETSHKIEALLTSLEMQHCKDAPILQLSSGEHKRFQLIKALLAPAQILILDSPFIGLDIKSRERLKDIINEKAANGTKFIIICDTFDMPNCITHVAKLEKGKLKSFEEKNLSTINSRSFNYTNYNYSFNSLPSATEKETNFSVAVKMVNTTIQYSNKVILNNVNWQVNHGEKWLIKGHNGAGKSTLLSLITGDNPQAYANEIYLFDKRRGTGESIWDIKEKIGYISPELHWYFDTSVTCYQTIGSGFFDTVGLYKKLNTQQHNILQQWLDFLHLSHVANKPLNSISTGQQRLILLTRALVKNPPLLVLDEPCQGLDEQHKNEFVHLVDELCEKFNKTLIYVSHYDNEIPQCIDHVMELQNNKQKIYSLNNNTAIAV